jgi:hypothetical protein
MAASPPVPQICESSSHTVVVILRHKVVIAGLAALHVQAPGGAATEHATQRVFVALVDTRGRVGR